MFLAHSSHQPLRLVGWVSAARCTAWLSARRRLASRSSSTGSATRATRTAPPRSPESLLQRRVQQRSQFETAAGCAVTAALTAAIVGKFAWHSVLSDEPVGRVMAAEALTLSSLLKPGGALQLLTSPLLHLDIFHLLGGVLSCTLSGLAAAACPTYNYRWAIIPLVFFGAGSAGGIARLLPDFSDALDSADAASWRRSHRDKPLASAISLATARVRADWDIRAYVLEMSKLLPAAYTAVAGRLWLTAQDERAIVFGAYDASVGLLTFSCCEWALGARAWPALLVPVIIVSNAVGIFLRAAPGMPLLTSSNRDSRRRWLPADYDARTGALGTIVAASTGAVFWCLGRGARLTTHITRLALRRRG